MIRSQLFFSAIFLAFFLTKATSLPLRQLPSPPRKLTYQRSRSAGRASLDRPYTVAAFVADQRRLLSKTGFGDLSCPETVEKLREFLPPEASVRNPVDTIASASGPEFEKAVRILLADPHVDSLIVIFVPPLVTEAAVVGRAIGAHQTTANYDNPIAYMT